MNLDKAAPQKYVRLEIVLWKAFGASQCRDRLSRVPDYAAMFVALKIARHYNSGDVGDSLFFSFLCLSLQSQPCWLSWLLVFSAAVSVCAPPLSSTLSCKNQPTSLNERLLPAGVSQEIPAGRVRSNGAPSTRRSMADWWLQYPWLHLAMTTNSQSTTKPLARRCRTAG
jgi:hypothetical protein